MRNAIKAKRYRANDSWSYMIKGLEASSSCLARSERLCDLRSMFKQHQRAAAKKAPGVKGPGKLGPPARLAGEQ